MEMRNINYYHFQTPDSPRNSDSDPIIGVSDDGTFEEMRWLLGASEVPVRMIAAQFISAISYSDSGCEKLTSSGCIPPLVKRISDPFCGQIVSSTILRLSSYSEAVSTLTNETMLIILLKAIKDSEVTWKETICKILIKLFTFNIPKLSECHLSLIMQLLGQETLSTVFESNSKNNYLQNDNNNVDIDLSLTIDAMPKGKNSHKLTSPPPLPSLSTTTTTTTNMKVANTIPSECTYLLHALTNSFQSSPFVRHLFLTSLNYQESLQSLLYTMLSSSDLDNNMNILVVLPQQLEGLLGLLHNYLLLLITNNNNNSQHDNIDNLQLHKLVPFALSTCKTILESYEISLVVMTEQQQKQPSPPTPPPLLQLLTNQQYGHSLTLQAIEIISSIQKILQSFIDDETKKYQEASTVTSMAVIEDNSSNISITNLQSYEVLLQTIVLALNNINKISIFTNDSSTSKIDRNTNSNTISAHSLGSHTSNTRPISHSHSMAMTSNSATGSGTAVTGNTREDSLEEFASHSNYVTSIVSSENNWIDNRADSK